MHEKLEGKVIWIIGASSGIGKALTQELANHNTRLIISARRKDKLHELASILPNITPLSLNLTNESEITSKTDLAISIYGKVDMVIFCAGLSQRTFAESTPITNTRTIMETNFFSSVIIAKKLIPVMKANSGGRFVIASSLMGRFGAQNRSSYSASKHALHGYFESLRAEEWQHNIHVTIAILGYINTDFSKNALTETGENYGHIDSGQKHGMSASTCAKIIISGIIKDKEEILIGGFEKYATFLKRFAPRILSRILRNKDIS